MPSYYIANEQLNISRGLVKGTTIVHIPAYNGAVDTTTDPETVWTHGGLYPWSALTAGGNHLSITSTSGSDTMQLLITGLDPSLNQITETVTLAGLTPVVTTKLFRRVRSLLVLGDTPNTGSIDANIGTSCVGHIEVGDSQSLNSCFTVPAGKTGYLYCGDASINSYNKDAVVRFYVRQPGTAFTVAHVVCLPGKPYRYDFPFPIPMPAGTDLEVRVDEVSDNNCKVSVNYSLLLVDTPVG